MTTTVAAGARLRQALPYATLPLALLACGLANAPWLRAFPASVLAVPLFGAALLAVLVPVLVVGIGLRPLWITALIDVVLFVFYELLVTLRRPTGFTELYDGIVHGPAQLLSYALPLVSPRTLLVAPVALCWLCGAVLGESIARAWHSVVAYATVLAAFGLAYAATARASTGGADGRRIDTLLAGTLLLVLLLWRALQTWTATHASTTASLATASTRALWAGAGVAVAVVVAVAALVQAPVFGGAPTAPARQPPVNTGRPLSPLPFVAGLRPADRGTPGRTLFTMTTNRAASRYVSLAGVDSYDGAGWSFDGQFKPSGGVLPPDPDPALRPNRPLVTQQYTVRGTALTRAPWLPSLYRAQEVAGLSVDIEPDSGLIVPATTLHDGSSYSVTSASATTSFGTLRPGALPATSAPPVDTELPGELRASLATLVRSLAAETGASTVQPLQFLQAVAADLRSHDGLTGARGPAGGAGFADVLAAVRQSRSATPEQFATITALVARELGVPAVVMSGFRVGKRATLPAGVYQVTGADAWTWVQIPVRGHGWVVLDPSPSSYAPAVPPSTQPRPSPSPSPSPTGGAQLTQSNNGGHAVAPPSAVPGGSDHTLAVLIGVLAVLVLIALAVVALLIGRKRMRAGRRRRAADPRQRVLGAWAEAIDLLAEVGLESTSQGGLAARTAAEVAADTARAFGERAGASVRWLGDAANAAIFAPGVAVTSEQADAAWQACVALRDSVRDRLSLRDRAAAQLRFHRAEDVVPRSPASWDVPARRAPSRHAGRRHRARRPLSRR